MKRTFLLLIIFLLAGALNYSSQAQLGGLLNKVKNKVVDRALGKESGDKTGNQAKEPDCATINDKVVFEFDKGYKMDMTEITVCIQNGDILLYSKLTNKYFVKKRNSDSPDGPYEADNSEVIRFNCNSTVSSNDKKDFSLIYPEFVSRSGEKYLIQFGGKSYGPYAIILNFVVSDLKTKFVAQVIPDMMFTEKESKELEKESKNADNMTMEQKMALGTKVQQKMMQKATSGNPMDFQMRVISNVPNVADNLGATVMYSSAIKYDEIVCLGAGQIMDLSGKTIFTYDMQKVNPYDGLWLSSDNTHYVTYSYGLLKFSDGKECNQVFSPWLVKEEGKVYLNYLYFSPKHNAIMQISNTF
jgi:hypothetical protein